MTVINIQRLSINYASLQAVKEVSLTVKQGEVLAIVGPNGAGKTSLVESFLGLRQPSAGSLEVLGMDPASRRQELNLRVGVQLQSAALPDRIRAGEVLELYAKFYSKSLNHQELLAEWGLADKGKAAFAFLSGGQKQRLFIALALVNDPELVFLDEISTGLDPEARRSTLGLVRKLKEKGKTVVLVSHYLDEVEEVADRVAVLKAGKLLALGTPKELCASYGGETQVSFSIPEGFDTQILKGLQGLSRISASAGQVSVFGTGALLLHTAAALLAAGYAPEDLEARRPGLEEVYFRLTGEEADSESSGKQPQAARGLTDEKEKTR